MDAPRELIRDPRGILYYQKGWYLYSSIVMTRKGKGASMGIIDDGGKTTLNVIRSYRMEVPLSTTLETSEPLATY